LPVGSYAKDALSLVHGVSREVLRLAVSLLLQADSRRLLLLNLLESERLIISERPDPRVVQFQTLPKDVVVSLVLVQVVSNAHTLSSMMD